MQKSVLNQGEDRLQNIWDRCMLLIRDNISQQSFITWFEPIKPIKLNGHVLTIQVPSRFFYEWLEEHYVDLIGRAIRRELGDEATLEYRIVVENTPTIPVVPNGQQPQAANTNNKFKNNKSSSKEDTPIKNPFVIPGLKKLNIDAQLNPNYTFTDFIEGECNQLARSAGYAVAQRPGGTSFNPLVLYGGVGLGKTHLAQAIGNYVKINNPNKTVLYVSSEKFTNQFIESVKYGAINDYINFYQLIDVLIVDDIQFFADKDRTQDIFFHIFNHLHQGGKQIILTSDRPPKDLQGMEERLISRFKWGLTTDLQAPAFETRMAILEKKMQSEGVELPPEVVEYVAYNITTNIRELEGVMISLLAQSSLSRREIDLTLAKKIVKSFVNNFSRAMSFETIQQTVSETLGVPEELMLGKSRKREIVQARQIAMYFCKMFTEASLKSIGGAFGGKDHSTVIHACQTVKDLIDIDKSFEKLVNEVEKKLKLSMGR